MKRISEFLFAIFLNIISVFLSIWFNFLIIINTIFLKNEDEDEFYILPFDAMEGYELALEKGSEKLFRKFACKDPYFALKYAKDIDKKSRRDTRKAACKDPLCAYEYAKDVDKCFNRVTRKAVKNTKYEKKYEDLFNLFSKEKII